MQREKIAIAFALVNPRRQFQEMARRGAVSQEAADRISWKGPINAAVTVDELDALGLTPEMVAEAIRVMTHSCSQVRAEVIQGTPWLSYWPRPGRPGFRFLALGYGIPTPRQEGRLTGEKSTE